MANLDDFDSNAGKSSKPRKPVNKSNHGSNDKIKGRKTPKKKGFAGVVAAVLPQADDSTGEKARKAFLLFAVAALIGSLIFLGWQLFNLKEGAKTNNNIINIAGETVDSSLQQSYTIPQQIDNPIMTEVTSAGTEEPEYIDLTPVVNIPLDIDFNALKEINPDVRAWIKITGTLINNPVVVGTDNNYYLSHDFNGEESVSGTIFSSYLNKWDGTDDNTILFGHNMHTGEFFAYVNHYVPYDASSEPLAFYKVHPTIMMSTPDGGCATYKIFAGMVANTQSKYGEVFRYVDKTKFTDVDDFNNFIIDVMDRSWFFTDVDLTYGDELLTLSTCWWPLGREVDTRWVLFARKVREGESEYVDTSKAYRNYQPKLFDYYYDIIGGSWTGSVWDKSKLLSYNGQ
ncbi:MAG: sortase [[Eubacterium] saphenum]|nr:sortase [[Eubacterium] saphenum]